MKTPALFEKWECLGLPGLPFGKPSETKTPGFTPVDINGPRCPGCRRLVEYCICDGTGKEPGDPGYDQGKAKRKHQRSNP